MRTEIAILSVALVALGAPSEAQTSELALEWDWVVSGQTTLQRNSALLGDAEQSSSQSFDALLDVEARLDRWTGLFAFKGSDIVSNQNGASYEGELIVQELFWQGSVNALQREVEMTLGKMRLDWGVGYGYRPLDVFKPYRRHPVGIQVEEGTLTAMGSYFDELGDWSLVYSDSSYTQQEGSQFEEAAEQRGIGVRRYAFVGDSEYQMLAYYDDVRHGLVGGSFVTVLDAAWGIHSSAVYQRHYLSYQQGEVFEPVSLTKVRDGFQVLAGLNWANQAGNNIILEYWYDSRSWGKQEWQQAFERIDSLGGVQHGLASSYAQGLAQSNLVAHNVMFHWSLDSSAWGHWGWSQDALWLNNVTPTLDVLYSPQDNGVIVTQWLDYQAYDSGRSSFNIEMALRFMAGEKDSVYANLSDKRMIFINLKGRF